MFRVTKFTVVCVLILGLYSEAYGQGYYQSTGSTSRTVPGQAHSVYQSAVAQPQASDVPFQPKSNVEMKFGDTPQVEPNPPMMHEMMLHEMMVEDCECDPMVMSEASKKEDESAGYNLTYKNGFLFAPKDEKKSPFSMRINGRMQFRYSGFRPNATTSVNQVGTVTNQSRSGFEIERARLEFRGFFYQPELKYYFNLDADTDDNHTVIFHDFWVTYEFSEALQIRVGKAKVPGSYEWWESSTTTRFADRSLSTTFFRADRSTGVWFDGSNEDRGTFYQVGITNGFFGADLDQGDIDDLFSYSGLFWWDPLGDFGSGYSDLKRTQTPLLRMGATGAYSNQNSFANGNNTSEPNFARLSDGTQLIATGALGPGLTVNDFDMFLVSGFMSGKYRGFSFNSEVYARWIQDIDTVEGPRPDTDELFDAGFYTDVGYMLIPEKLEVNGRISNINGFFGNAWEYALGANWFFNGNHKHKLTFDATRLDGAPAGSSSPNFEVGQNGILYRMQYQAAF